MGQAKQRKAEIQQLKTLSAGGKNYAINFKFNIMDEEEYQYIFDGLSKTHSITWKYPYVWENWKRNADS